MIFGTQYTEDEINRLKGMGFNSSLFVQNGPNQWTALSGANFKDILNAGNPNISLTSPGNPGTTTPTTTPTTPTTATAAAVTTPSGPSAMIGSSYMQSNPSNIASSSVAPITTQQSILAPTISQPSTSINSAGLQNDTRVNNRLNRIYGRFGQY